ncbi:hypothetical protein [Paenibacillus illinoisensis]|uniref:Uncharacterized protein n=1 Tax=Paenibacillus illinoisensis TaxID=59845 RepID=A0A2W0CJ90_9BACL|nr:hypothetical protein [Paenibacillus illinoisensis]PYY30959.1 Uncharacterized protein PIL02S_00506 [Paenibacillus illinoisensis]
MRGIQKRVCLIVSMGNFERHMEENLNLAKEHGQHVFTLTGDGLVDIDEAQRIPVNILKLTTPELQVWSSMINEQIIELGIHSEDMVIFAVGQSFRGILPIGIMINHDLRIGA